MYEDKLKEKIEFDRKAVDEMFAKLSSMVGNGGSAAGLDKSMFAFKAVLSAMGFRNTRIDDGGDIRKSYGEILGTLGILARPVVLHGKWWKDATGPFLARDEEGNFVALLPGFLGYYRLDAETGRRARVDERMMKDLGDTVLCFCRELPRRKLTLKDLLHYTHKTISLKNILYVLFFCLVVILLGMLIPFANKVIFNDVVPSGEVAGIIPICSFLLGLAFSTALFELYRNMVLTRAKDKLNANLQPAVMARVYSLPNRFFKEYSSGDLSARALSINSVYQFITNELMVAVVVGLLSSLYIFVAFNFAKDLVLLLTLILAAYLILSVVVYRSFTKQNRKVLPHKTSAQGFVFSLISGIHKIRNNGAEARAMQQWADRFAKSEFLTAETPKFVIYQKATALFILKLSSFAVFFFARKSRMSMSDFIAFNAAFSVMLVAFDQLQFVMVDVSQILPQIQLIQPILDAVPDSDDESETVENISGGIELSNVTFRYSPNTPSVIKSMSLKITPGENIGIVGYSGCGKSSLMRLMMGFETPTSGSIFYDQYNLSHTNLNSLHQFTGYCPQDIHIFPDTIKNNIRITKPSASDDEIWEAAAIACIDEDIKRMPEGMDTVLGEGGSGLSGGQCQRIMIARAVLNRPRIIFFDEATSALDNITQKKVVENLSALKCTRVSIAHRLSTIENCDRIIVLDKGIIVEDGSPESLMKKQGFFYRLAKRQQL